MGRLLLLLALALLHPAAAFRQDGGCLFPARWQGTWFQSGVRAPIVIEAARLSTKGTCLASEGDKFLLVDDKRVCYRCVVIHEKHANVLQYKETECAPPIVIEAARLSTKGTCLASEGDKFLLVDDKRVCYRCVVIHEKHANVLQYKETFCHDRDSLPSLCRMITGDALLYSMFREGALSVPCPFRGPFSFTYNRGHGECRSPVSSIDVCTEESRLLLSYQACPDVYGTESTVEELECLATWKEGSSRYLVGKVHHVHATSNEDRFRCFVWEKAAATPGTPPQPDDVDFRVAQSGDATCNGLFSATEGSRTMTLRRAPTLPRCKFPHWLSASLHWHTLDYSVAYSFHHRNSTLRVANTSANTDMKVVCAQLRHQLHGQREGDAAVVVAHFTMGCQSGYMCMAFHRRDGHVVELQTGAHARRPEDACLPFNFNKTLPYITLVTTSPEPRQCPYMGKFTVTSLTVQPEHEHEREYSARSLRKRDWARWRHTLPEFHAHARSEVHSPGHSAFHQGKLSRRKRVDQMGPCSSDGFRTLVVGCSTIDTMEFYSDCPSADLISSYSCHGRWEENGTHYLITTPLSRSSHGARRYCFIYREERSSGVDGGEAVLRVHVSSSSRSCDRALRPGLEGALAFNATSTGKCVETSNSDKHEISLTLFLLTVLPTVINYVVLQTKR